MALPDGAVVLTGATGFVGALVLERLLARPGVEVVCPVRAPDDAAAQARLAALAVATWGDADVLDGRVRAVAADLQAPGLGRGPEVLDALAGAAGTVVHCAASIDFELPLAEARAINVDGTRTVRDVAAAARQRGLAGRLVHVSTAYVHGRAATLGREDGPRDADPRNTYEQTKLEAEGVARELDGTAIVRPSVVVGDSRTGWTSAYNVVYPTLRLLARRVLRTVPARPDSVVDLVAVDQVADVVVAAAERPELTGAIQAVAGEEALSMDRLAGMVAEHLGLPPLPFDPDAAGRLGAYAPYTDVRGRFELRRARKLGFDPVPAHELLPRVLDFAQAARWGKVRPAPLRPRPVPATVA